MTAEVAHKPLTGWPLFLVTNGLSIATFMIVLDYSIANVSIPYIAGDLAISVDQGTYVITSFAVGNAVVLPLTGWLTKRLGGVRLIITSLLLFTLLSWLCGASLNFGMLVICRFLQGVFSGPLIPLSQSLLIANTPPEKKHRAISFWSTIVIVAPIAGPLLGGWITFDYKWPWIFYINIPVGLLSTLTIWLILKNRDTPKTREPVDWLGLTFLFLGVTSLQIFLDKGQQWDWWASDRIRVLSITSFICFTLLLLWEHLHHRPLLELKLFRIRSFAISVLFMAVIYAIYFGSIVLVPLWLQTYMGYTSPWAGIAVAPIGIVPFLLSSWSGKLISRWGSLILLTFCFAFFALSSFFTAFLTVQVDIYYIGFSRFLLGCALFFFTAPLIALSVQDIPVEKLPSSTGIFHFVRAMVGAIGTSLFTTLWARRTIYYHEIIGSELTPFNPNTQYFFHLLKKLPLSHEKGLEILNNLADNQAAVLALNECFYLMGWICLALLFFIPLGRKKKSTLATAP